MIPITLKPGVITTISDEDFELCFYNCYLSNDYASYRNREKHPIYVHHKVIERMGLVVPIGHEIDHEDRDKLNNQRYNLRIVTSSINRHNVNLDKNNNSGVTGVSYYSRVNKWLAQINVSGKRIHLGYFNSFELAVNARKLAENKYLIKRK